MWMVKFEMFIINNGKGGGGNDLGKYDGFFQQPHPLLLPHQDSALFLFSSGMVY